MPYSPSWSDLDVNNVRKLFLYFQLIRIFQITCFRVELCSFFFYTSLNFNSSLLLIFTHFQNVSMNRILSFNFDGQCKLSDLLHKRSSLTALLMLHELLITSVLLCFHLYGFWFSIQIVRSLDHKLFFCFVSMNLCAFNHNGFLCSLLHQYGYS